MENFLLEWFLLIYPIFAVGVVILVVGIFVFKLVSRDLYESLHEAFAKRFGGFISGVFIVFLLVFGGGVTFKIIPVLYSWVTEDKGNHYETTPREYDPLLDRWGR